MKNYYKIKLGTIRIGTLFCVLLMCVPVFLFSQIEYRPIFSQPQVYILNSGMNSFYLSGTSRVAIPINLPAETVAWIYRITVADKNEYVSGNYELMDLIQGIARVSNIPPLKVFGMIPFPKSGPYCTAYIFDGKQNAINFENTKPCTYYKRLQNTLSCNQIEESLIKPEIYLGIENPKDVAPIKVKVEAVAAIFHKGYLGVMVKDLDNVARQKSCTTVGVFIDNFLPNGNASNAGMRRYDVITKINDTYISNVMQFQQLMKFTPANQSVKVTFMRECQEMQTYITLKGLN